MSKKTRGAVEVAGGKLPRLARAPGVAPGGSQRVGQGSAAKPKRDVLAPLVAEVRRLIQSARRGAASAVNSIQVMANFEIGRHVVEHEQKGEKRAAYGAGPLHELSARLTKEFGRGFSKSNLAAMRTFYLLWADRLQIFQKASGKLAGGKILQKASGNFTGTEAVSGPSAPRPAFALGWSHYVELLSVKNPEERAFYEIEAANSGWSVPELRRQKAASLYERLALSRDKDGIRKLAREGQVVARPEDLFKEPLVLEFLGLDEQAAYSESDLESSLINHLEKFLLELGKGFLFEARQKRFTFDGDHYFLDLVFYNRLLRCHVLIDLKLDKLTHQDLGQMQMYVNYYDQEVKREDENRTIGLLLRKSKKDAVVRLTLPRDANIHAREYQLYLPSKELLKDKLLEWTRAEEESG